MFRRTAMLTVTSLFLISGLSLWCLGKIDEKKNAQVTTTVTEDIKTHQAVIDMSEKEFAKAGFELGDSVDIKFENGYSLLDVPYYSGFYVRNGEAVMVAYEEKNQVAITYNNVGIWNRANLEDNEEVTIKINKKHKYSSIEDTMSLGIDPDRRYFPSDEAFANFREIKTTNIKSGLLYRGSSPIDNSHNRAHIADELISKAGIKYIIDLTDSAEDIERDMDAPRFNSPYFTALCYNNRVSLLNIDTTYTTSSFHHKLVQGLRDMMKYNGPVYIHCKDGKENTGFVCFLLEALAGGTYNEMKEDYMLSYENYYQITADKTPEKYEAVSNLYFESFAAYLHDTDDLNVLEAVDYKEDAVRYLLNGGMTMDEITNLQKFITK